MPLSAMRAVKVDHSVPLAEMGNLLTRLVSEPVSTDGETPVPESLKIEIMVANEDNGFELGITELGEKTSLTCPDCHGALVEIHEGDATRFRCHTGHGFTLGVLLEEATKDIENSLRRTLSKIEENEMLPHRVGGKLTEINQPEAAGEISLGIESAKQRAKLVREAVFGNESNGKEQNRSS
ncbi:MAG TPA: hypothetical protein VIL74_07185 [Pyrinomonadaceae bacterium]|jgi:two-component system chemotaxis response regulator CheB